MAVSGATENLSTAMVLTLRDTAGALLYTPPSGFSAWSSGTGPVVGGGQSSRVMVVA
jgi:hypothetical protein